jgi:aminopeptidase N
LNRSLNVALAIAALAACAKREAAAPTEAPTPSAPASEAALGEDPATGRQPASAARDAFSRANLDEARVTHLDLDLTVNFEKRIVEGAAILDFERVKPDAKRLVLDTNDLDIRSVEALVDGAFVSARYEIGADDPSLGAPLSIELPKGASRIRIAYASSPGAEGLQWLTPAQTAGGKQPFMYSQNQTIYARSMAPVQDTPALRMTYSATIRTPKDLLAVMSAAQDSGPRDGEYRFEMRQPVPAYLLAIAVGDLAFLPLSDTMGVYAEPSIVEAARAEFADTPQMERAASALYGAYRWDRYDLLVLPPAFPFGGMENPRLSFLTPTLIAGDKSLTNVVAHELAHSWSGNLVTNATWRDAWLNEGVTSYVENRIMEALYGADRAVMEQALSLEDLKETVAGLEDERLGALKLPDDLADSEDAFSDVAYVKGQFFLHFLEQRYGRDAFDAFLKSWFDAFAFKPATTEDFVAFYKANLQATQPDAVSDAEFAEWLFEGGIPASIADPKPAAFARVDAARSAFLKSSGAPAFDPQQWTAQEWLRFITLLPDDVAPTRLAALDSAFALTTSQNAEIAFAWYMKGIAAGYAPATDEALKFVQRVGRGKFLYPLYGALKKSGKRAEAERVFEKARSGYHPIAQRRVSEILQAAN